MYTRSNDIPNSNTRINTVLANNAHSVIEENKFAPAQTQSDIALEAAKKTLGPRTFILKGLRDKNAPVFWVLGCQGSGNKNQQAVANLMMKIIENGKNDPNFKKPDFILFLGDNFYDYGVKSSTHKDFMELFHIFYDQFGIPCFLILGNHDANCHKAARLGSKTLALEQGKSVEMHQIAHTLVPDGKKYHTSDELVKIFSRRSSEDENSYLLHLADLQSFNEPFRFYSLVLGNKQIFCLNSNCMVKHFIKYMEYQEKKNQEKKEIKNKIDNKNIPIALQKNQLVWLEETYKKAEGEKRDIIFAIHQLPKSSGKRAKKEGHDSNNYLYAQQIAKACQLLGVETTSHNELIDLICKKFGFKSPIWIGAHDHFVSLDDEIEALTITSGGGGSNLQSLGSLKRYPFLKSLLSMYGFHVISNDGIELYAIDPERDLTFHLIYDDKKHEFKREKSDNQDVEEMRDFILKKCDEFFTDLKQKEILADEEEASPKKNESYLQSIFNVPNALFNIPKKISSFFHSHIHAQHIARAQEFVAYFNQPKLPTLDKITSYLKQELNHLPTVENGLDAFLGKHFISLLDKLESDYLTKVKQGLAASVSDFYPIPK